MAALPTFCLSALRALISGVSLDSLAAPSSVSTSAQPSLGVSPPYTSLASSSSSSSRLDDEHLYYKEADEKSREDEYIERDYEFAGLQRFGRASLVALAAASMCYAAPDPAHALRGGERFRQEVTYSQDLVGSDLYGSTQSANLASSNLEGRLMTENTCFECSAITDAESTEAD